MPQQRTERVELETTRHRITGDVTLAANGFRSRVSDLLNASEREFLALTDVELVPLDGGEPSPPRVRRGLRGSTSCFADAAAGRVRLAAQRRGRDSNPRYELTPYTRFPVAPVQPLRHLSRSSDPEG